MITNQEFQCLLEWLRARPHIYISKAYGSYGSHNSHELCGSYYLIKNDQSSALFDNKLCFIIHIDNIIRIHRNPYHLSVKTLDNLDNPDSFNMILSTIREILR